ncbi:MAG: FmdB family zinc ribbon protein [Acidobacteriota bacterium]
MPTYEYRCKACGHRFEEFLTISEYAKHKAKCPKCKGRKVERVLTTFFAKTSRKA